MSDTPETVTISKSAYETLIGIKTLMDKAWDDKSVGAQFRKTLKAIDPALKVPEDIAESVIAPLKGEMEETRAGVKKFEERLDKFLSERKDKDDEDALRSELAAAQKKYGLDEAGMNKVMQRMKDKNNPDVEAAAAFVLHSAPKPQPTSQDYGLGATGADLFGAGKKDDSLMELHNGGDPLRPGGWFDKEATKVLNEMQGQAAA